MVQESDGSLEASDALLERLIAAAGAGDLDAAQACLAKWQGMDNPVPGCGGVRQSLYWLHPALAAAAHGHHLPIVEFLLERGIAPAGGAIVAAIRVSSLGALELFLQYGWDINRCTYNLHPPPLS